MKKIIIKVCLLIVATLYVTTLLAAGKLVKYTIITPNNKPFLVNQIDVYAGPTCNNVGLISTTPSDPNCGTDLNCQNPADKACKLKCVWVEPGKDHLTAQEIREVVGARQACYIEKFHPEPKEGFIQIQLEWSDSKEAYINADPANFTRTFK